MSEIQPGSANRIDRHTNGADRQRFFRSIFGLIVAASLFTTITLANTPSQDDAHLEPRRSQRSKAGVGPAPLLIGQAPTILSEPVADNSDALTPVPAIEPHNTDLTKDGVPHTWGLDRIDQRTSASDGLFRPMGDGSGVDIYIFDTGIRRTHTELYDRVAGGKSFVPTEPDPFHDCGNHGTKVASAAAGRTIGVAPGANIYSVKVINCDRQGYVSWVSEAVDWVIESHSGPTVANFSFGVPISDTRPYNSLVSRLTNAGITVVVSAGNNSRDACQFEPASSAAAITVGATNQNDVVASYSNTGSCVDIFAPGSNNLIATADHDAAFDTSKTGTSLAAPYVAGAAALYLQHNPKAQVAMVRLHLLHASPTTNVLSKANGSPNRLLFVGQY